MTTYQSVLEDIFGEDLLHYWVLDAMAPLEDQVGSLDAVARGSGTTWSKDGVRFDGRGWLEIPDHADLSVSTRGALAWVYEVAIHDWRGVGGGGQNSAEYIHLMGKGDTGGASGNHEYAFRHYKKGGSGEAVTRKDRTSFYVFNAAGSLGAGSFVQEDAFSTRSRLVCGGSNIAKNSVSIRVDGEGDADPLSGYNIKPVDKGAPVRVGTRDMKTGFAVATFKRMALLARVPTVAEFERLRAARPLPDREAPVVPPDPPVTDTLLATGLDDVVEKHNALVREYRKNP